MIAFNRLPEASEPRRPGIPGLDTNLNSLFTIDAVNDSGVTGGTQVKSVQ